jgi:peptidoglycan/xylan/chitin deacetylase (PgdA/CDA1 family)
MNKVSRMFLWALMGLLCPLQTVFAQNHQITYFRHNHAGAVTIGFDDGRETQFTVAFPLLNAKGIKGTFFITTQDMPVSWENWRQVAAQGHEIASHTVTHAYLLTLTDSELRYELSESQRAINENIPSQSCISFAYPGNDNNAHIQAVASEYYVSARGGWADPEGGDMNFYEDMDPNLEPQPGILMSLGHRKAINFYDVAGDTAPLFDTLANMEGKLDFAVSHHAWYDMYLHDVTANSPDIPYLNSLLEDMLARDLWVATYGEVALYMRERLASTLGVVSSDSSALRLSLANSLDSTVYKEPLTIRSVVPNSWINVSITQGSSSTTIPSTMEGDARVVYYDAVPNGGTIVLTQPGPLSGVSISPTAVQGGSSSIGTVTLNAAAPAGGTVISLTSSDTAAVQLPTSVTVPAGWTTATFTATTSAVASNETVTITALYDDDSRTTSLTVTVMPPAAMLIGVAMNPTTVQGGMPSIVTVTLDAPAPIGGALISLTSSDTTSAQVPASVTVSAGDKTASFMATSSALASNATLTITALYDSVSKTAMLMVIAPTSLSSVTVNPTSVEGGLSSIGAVHLDAPAPTGGAAISLTSSNTAAAQVPTSVIVPGGATTATFTVLTSPVSLDATLTIAGLYNGVSRTATMMVTAPAKLSKVSVSPTSVRGGVSLTGTVSLDSPAPAGGAVISLASSNTSVAQVPASVTVVAGALSATFTATSSPVPSKILVTVTALYSGVSKTTIVTVTSAALSKVSVSPTSVRGGISSTGTVTLDAAAAAGGAIVSLTSSNTAAQVSQSVTVPAGAKTASFTATTSPVSATNVVTVTAFYSGVSKTATLTVTPAALSKVTVNPTSVLGGLSSTGTATLDAAAPAGGALISLTSSNTAAAQVPASVIVLPGDKTAAFTVTTSGLGSNTAVTITGLYNSVTQNANLTVKAPVASAISLNPASVQGGNPSAGTVVLNGPAPDGGTVITLASSSTAVAKVPASVTVASGETGAIFAVTTMAVTSAKSVTISATGGVTVKAILTVTH